MGLHWHVGHIRGLGFFDHEQTVKIAMKTRIKRGEGRR
jgi:metal-dependent hydrolase (beta-lactamase superfamily II)